MLKVSELFKSNNNPDALVNSISILKLNFVIGKVCSPVNNLDFGNFKYLLLVR